MGACVECGQSLNHLHSCSVGAAKDREWKQKISDGLKKSWLARGLRSDPERAWRDFAGRAVNRAVRLGFLPALDGSYLCVDCGAIATQWEHRDYTRVIDVEPVCASCNASRPRAPMPKPRQFPKIRKKV